MTQQLLHFFIFFFILSPKLIWRLSLCIDFQLMSNGKSIECKSRLIKSQLVTLLQLIMSEKVFMGKQSVKNINAQLDKNVCFK